MEAVATVATALPTSLMTRLARQQTQAIDFATSNVRASPVPVYIAGAKTLGNYPVGPLAGVAFNATMISYNGNLDIGINFDAAAVEHPARMAELLGDSFTALHKVEDARRSSASRGATVRPVSAGTDVSSMRTSSRRSATSPLDTSSRPMIRRSD